MKDEKCWILNRKETIRYLGYRDNEPDEIMLEEMIECEEMFLTAVKPKYIYDVYELVCHENHLYTADMEFEFIGNHIKNHLLGCEQVAFTCLTLSKEVDDLIDQAQKENMLHALIYDAIANASIEELRKKAESMIAKEQNRKVNWLFGIGYGDLPLTTQSDFLTKICAFERIGVSVNEKSVLIPLKSVTGFIGLSKDKTEQTDCQQNNCSICNLRADCSYHRQASNNCRQI